MSELLIRLFEETTQEKVPDTSRDDVYAIAAQVVLRSGYASAGALSVEENGLLCMHQPGVVGDPNVRSRPPLPIIAEHYFTVDDIMTLIVVRKLKTETTPVIHMG